MRNAQNISEIAKLNPDYLGFIFYEKSPRFVETGRAPSLPPIPKHIKKVGVFVNETAEKILETVEKYGLDLVQLHGAETPEFCRSLKQKMQNVQITKAINIENILDIEKTKMYDNDCCDYFLFDSPPTPPRGDLSSPFGGVRGGLHGGTGQKFQWWTLDWYDGEIPFFLSGGISIDDVEKLKEIHHDRLYGIDINSRFEIEPALKDVEKVKQFLNQLH